MDQIIVTKPDDSTWALVTKSNVTAVTRAEQKRALLGEDIITMTVESATKLTFDIGDKITIFGSTYMLNALPKLLKGGKRKITYNITWEGRQYDLLKVRYLDEDSDGISISSDFALTGNLSFFMGVLINNCKRIFGDGTWLLGDYPETDYLTLTFSDENCLSVLQKLCDQDNFNKEFEIVENSGVFTINIKDTIGETHPTTYEYGKGKGLWNLTGETVSDKDIITRFYVFGSSKNLRPDYRGYAQRLKLPENDLSYIENQDAIDAYGLREGVKVFDNIYPHRTGTVTSVGSINEFFDSSMDFDLNEEDGEGNTLYLINGTTAKIHFKTGNLAGYQFELASYEHSTKKFTINSFTDERGQEFPDPKTSAFQIAAGDKYVILDIMMPESYVTSAETELQTIADAYYPLLSKPRVQYSLTFDELYFKQKYAGQSIVNVFGIGDNIPIKDTDVSVDTTIRLRSLKRNIIQPYVYELDLYDYSEESLEFLLLSASNKNSTIINMNNLGENAALSGQSNSRYALANHTHTGVYATVDHLHTETYIPLITTPTNGNFPTINGVGALNNSAYSYSSFEPAITKGTGYYYCNGTAWSFVNESYIKKITSALDGYFPVISGTGGQTLVSSAWQPSDLAGFAPVAGPTFTGVVTASGALRVTGTTKAAGYFYAGTTTPTNSTRLNYDGYLYAKKLYSEGIEVSVSGHTHSGVYEPVLGSSTTAYILSSSGTTRSWISKNNVYTAYQTLTDAATITWNMNSGYNAKVTLGGNRTLSITNVANGMSGILIVKQDATGGRTLTLPSGSIIIGGGILTLSSAANSVDILTFTYDGTNYLWSVGTNYLGPV